MTAINPILAFQNTKSINGKLTVAIKKIAQELTIAKNKLAFQNEDNDKRTAELIVANREFAFQNIEKEKRAAELVITNNKLAYKNIQREIQTARLNIANKELISQNEEKEKRAAELVIINIELKNAIASHKEYIEGLRKMMFITSHKVRIPIANILGLTKLFEDEKDNPDEQMLYLKYIRQSALSLDDFTKELTAFISNLEQKVKL